MNPLIFIALLFTQPASALLIGPLLPEDSATETSITSQPSYDCVVGCEITTEVLVIAQTDSDWLDGYETGVRWGCEMEQAALSAVPTETPEQVRQREFHAYALLAMSAGGFGGFLIFLLCLLIRRVNKEAKPPVVPSPESKEPLC